MKYLLWIYLAVFGNLQNKKTLRHKIQHKQQNFFQKTGQLQFFFTTITFYRLIEIDSIQIVGVVILSKT